jgi:hypothetical protein
MTNVSPGDDLDIVAHNLTRYALAGWGRTARLCAVRLAERSPLIAYLLIWLTLRR